jgi:hypothetical protein
MFEVVVKQIGLHQAVAKDKENGQTVQDYNQFHHHGECLGLSPSIG